MSRRGVVVHCAPLTSTARSAVLESGHDPLMRLTVRPESGELMASCVAAEMRQRCSFRNDTTIELFAKAFPPSSQPCYFYRVTSRRRRNTSEEESGAIVTVAPCREALATTTADDVAPEGRSASSIAFERSARCESTATSAVVPSSPLARIFVDEFESQGKTKRLHSALTLFDARQVSRMRAFNVLDDLRTTKSTSGFLGVSSDKRHGVSYTFTYRCVDIATDREVTRRASGNFKTALEAAEAKLSLYKHCVALFDAETYGGSETSVAVYDHRSTSTHEGANEASACALTYAPLRIIDNWYPCG